jgi:hypothetical protein
VSKRPHGYARYKLDGCRCYTCGFARSEYEAMRTRAILYGTWAPFVDAEPVRAHVRMLSEAGIGWKRVAKLAGLSTSTLTKLLYGVQSQGRPPAVKMRAENAQKILAVEPGIDILANSALLASVGTVRRLQALVRRGWPQAELAARLGMADGNFSTLLRLTRITAAKARAVRDLYDQLQNQDPAAHGISAVGYSRAVAAATRAGWPLPAMWDDDVLDDPDGFPDWTGDCGTERGYYLHYRDHVPMCEPCRAAKKAAAAERKQAA